MYRHLLVPLDGTELSIELVGNAVALARTLAARITFLHLLADDDASLRGEDDVLRLLAPAEHAWMHGGRARELLAKAEAAAHALGVPSTPLTHVGSEPAAAIVEAARAAGCDLIVMASHGGRSKLGMAFGSDTLAVVMRAGLPVLVTSSGELPAPARAIGVLRDEHRAIAAALHAWLQALAQARAGERAPDAALMQALLRWLREFPATLHHPKEDEHLFARLRLRAPALEAELDELARQHRRDGEWLDTLEARVAALVEAGDADRRASALAALDEAVQGYAAFTWEHLGREEGVVLPAAQRHLQADDWAAIDAGFAANRGRDGAGEHERSLRLLFERLMAMAERQRAAI